MARNVIIADYMDKTKEHIKVILELVIELRANSQYDFFRYDYSLIRKKLAETKNFSKYGISAKEQREILKELGGSNILEINYVDEESHNWYHDCKNISEYISPDLSPLMHLSDIYIILPVKNIPLLEKEYGLKKYQAELTLRYGKFIVKCNGGEYALPQLRESGLPAAILEYAWKHLGTPITRTVLAKDGVTKSRSDESLKKVFKGSRVMVEEILSPFITLTADMIVINPSAEIDGGKLQDIIEYAVRQ